jgi:hypothetical protein
MVVEVTYVCEGCEGVQTMIYDETEDIPPLIRCGAKGVCLGTAWKVEIKEGDDGLG